MGSNDNYSSFAKVSNIYMYIGASLIAQLVKNPPTMQKMQVQSRHWENSLGKSMVTHSSILAWRIPGMGESGGLPSMGSHRVGHD